MGNLVSYNRISINKKINESLKQSRYEKFAYNAANFRFQIARTESLKSFDEDLITKELKEGPTADNSVLGYGNLVSYIGLPNSKNEVAFVRDYLYNNFRLDNKANFIQNKSKVYYSFKVESPSLQEIYDNFPAPDKSYSQSWISIIEDGYGRFAYYVYRLAGFPESANSRTGTGLQRKTIRSWIDVPSKSPQFKWVSKTIEKFLDYFKK